MATKITNTYSNSWSPLRSNLIFSYQKHVCIDIQQQSRPSLVPLLFSEPAVLYLLVPASGTSGGTALPSTHSVHLEQRVRTIKTVPQYTHVDRTWSFFFVFRLVVRLSDGTRSTTRFRWFIGSEVPLRCSGTTRRRIRFEVCSTCYYCWLYYVNFGCKEKWRNWYSIEA